MGFALISMKNYAIRDFDQVITIPKQSDPGHEEALLGKGIVLFYLNNYTGSLSYMNRALNQSLNDFAALQNKGLVLFNLGDHLGALKYLDAAIASNPKDASVYYNKGLVLSSAILQVQ
jgi:tetratricopeptide (TPR) repeat protein